MVYGLHIVDSLLQLPIPLEPRCLLGAAVAEVCLLVDLILCLLFGRQVQVFGVLPHFYGCLPRLRRQLEMSVFAFALLHGEFRTEHDPGKTVRQVLQQRLVKHSGPRSEGTIAVGELLAGAESPRLQPVHKAEQLAEGVLDRRPSRRVDVRRINAPNCVGPLAAAPAFRRREVMGLVNGEEIRLGRLNVVGICPHCVMRDDRDKLRAVVGRYPLRPCLTRRDHGLVRILRPQELSDLRLGRILRVRELQGDRLGHNDDSLLHEALFVQVGDRAQYRGRLPRARL